MSEYTDIKLVLPSAPEYLLVSGRFAREWRARRQHDAYAAGYTRLLAMFESAIRSVLALYLPGQEERILSYLRFTGRPARQRRLYREIDFVAGYTSEPSLFVEIKTREAWKASVGSGQLSQSLSIGRLRWPNLRGLWLNVFMGTALGIGGASPPQMVSVADLPLRISDGSGEANPVIAWVDGDDIISLARNHGFLHTTFMEEVREARDASAAPLRSWKAGQNGPELGSIGDRLQP